MHIKTKLPFKHIYFRHWGADDREMAIFIVKIGVYIAEGGVCTFLLKTQPELLLTDVFHGEVNLSALRQEGDLAPFKPRTDVTFHAVARAPEAKSLESWPVSVQVGQRLSYQFHVFGERFWEAKHGLLRKKWQLSSIAPTSAVPLTYDYAYGGDIILSDNERVTHAYNPLGRGLICAELLENGENIAAPQIALLGEFAAARPQEPMTVCGLGPIQKSWLPRLALAGTFDAAWQRERHPRMPLDYDFAYWNAAPLPLQAMPYLAGDEKISLQGLRHDPKPYQFQLPGIALSIRVRRDAALSATEHRLNLDTVHCDISESDQAKHWMSMTWRITLPEPDDIEEIELFAHKTEKLTL